CTSVRLEIRSWRSVYRVRCSPPCPPAIRQHRLGSLVPRPQFLRVAHPARSSGPLRTTAPPPSCMHTTRRIWQPNSTIPTRPPRAAINLESRANLSLPQSRTAEFTSPLPPELLRSVCCRVSLQR